MYETLNLHLVMQWLISGLGTVALNVFYDFENNVL